MNMQVKLFSIQLQWVKWFTEVVLGAIFTCNICSLTLLCLSLSHSLTFLRPIRIFSFSLQSAPWNNRRTYISTLENNIYAARYSNYPLIYGAVLPPQRERIKNQFSDGTTVTTSNENDKMEKKIVIYSVGNIAMLMHFSVGGSSTWSVC